jgi:hypothetical protein
MVIILTLAIMATVHMRTAVWRVLGQALHKWQYCRAGLYLTPGPWGFCPYFSQSVGYGSFQSVYADLKQKQGRVTCISCPDRCRSWAGLTEILYFFPENKYPLNKGML